MPPILIVLATGYKRQEELVRKLFGEKVVDRIGPIWGLARPGCATCIPAPASPACGSSPEPFAQCRINSKYLALQIKAVEEGRCRGMHYAAETDPLLRELLRLFRAVLS